MSAAVAPALPWSYRPLGVRVVLSVLAVLLIGVVAFLWLALPPSVRDDFTTFQVITLLVLLGAALFGIYGLMRCRVGATERGIDVVNVFRRRHLEWAEVLRVSQRPGDPWAILDTDDGNTVAVMAIQGSDGVRARTAVSELRRLVETQTRTSRND
jgi:Bacterial PH domain